MGSDSSREYYVYHEDEETSLPEINLRISTSTEESSTFGPCLLTY